MKTDSGNTMLTDENAAALLSLCEQIGIPAEKLPDDKAGPIICIGEEHIQQQLGFWTVEPAIQCMAKLIAQRAEAHGE